MSLLQTKKDFEQYFLDNYNETAVHWAGMKFDTTTVDEWIYFEYAGRQVGDCGYDNTQYVSSGFLNITIVALNRYRTHEIADIVLDVFKGAKVGDSTVHSVNISATGTIEDIDKSYIDLNIQIKMI